MHSKIQSLINELNAGKLLRADGPKMQGDPRFDAHTVVLQAEQAARVFDMSGCLPRYDADEAVTLARQLLFIQAKEVYQQFSILKATKLLPVDGSIPSGASSFSTPIYGQVGTAEFVTNYGNGFPAVDVNVSEVISPVRSIGDSYFYTVQDLRAAAMAGGQPLDQRRAMVARMVHDRKVEKVAAFGDSVHGLPGFLTNSAVTLLKKSSGGSLPDLTGGWETASGADIYEDLGIIAAQVPSQSMGNWEADTIVLPLLAFEIAARTPYSTLNPTPVLKAFLDASPHIKNIDWWSPCDNIDENGDSPISNSTTTRAVCYSRSPMVLDLKIPQQFEQFAPQLVNMQFNVPCHSRIGGVSIYYPAAMVYADQLVDCPDA